MLTRPPIAISIQLFFLFVFPLTLLISACDDSKEVKQSSGTEANGISTIRLGITRSPSSWLVHIADSKGYFKQQGLNISLINFKSGKRALKAMFDDRVDLATTAEGPVVFFSLIRDDFSIVSTISITSNDNVIVARKDVGIESPADLKGKAIATQVASSAHYYLYLFLKNNDMTGIDIIQSYMDIEKLPDAIVSGLADAIASREPYISETKKRLGDNAIVFETPGLYLKSFLLVGFRDYLEDNPEKMQKIVAALLQAEQFVNDNQSQAIELLAKKFSLTNEEVSSILQYLDLSISLDQLLLDKLKDEANWILESKLTENWNIPNYMDFIDRNALNIVKPEAIEFVEEK